jgi:hypothetical protein
MQGFRWAGPAILVIALVATAHGGADGAPKHLRDAQVLVKHLDLANTSYRHGEGVVHWKGSEGSKRYESHTDCSGLLNHLLAHSYGYTRGDLAKWFGKKRPTADRYHDRIKAGTGFTKITHVKDIRPGDILAVKYLVARADTGHVMLVAGTPQKMQSSKPMVTGTEQWQVTIIDSSKSGHGPTDTRYRKGPSGKDHSGLGQGVLRLYVDKQGKVAGFSWSTLAVSKFQDPRDEHLVIGRLVPGYRP